MRFRGPARRMTARDVEEAARALRVEVPVLLAVLDVEAAGSGFDDQGRPRMLYEPHWFYRLLKQQGKTDKLKKARVAGVAYRTWGMRPYPKDSYPRLEIAMSIDWQNALKSASWGLPQILGVNHVTAGYKTVQGMVTAFTRSERAQLMAFVRFLQRKGYDRHLRSKDWAAFSRGYNGPLYKVRGYDAKLRRAYARRLTEAQAGGTPRRDGLSAALDAIKRLLKRLLGG